MQMQIQSALHHKIPHKQPQAQTPPASSVDIQHGGADCNQIKCTQSELLQFTCKTEAKLPKPSQWVIAGGAMRIPGRGKQGPGVARQGTMINGSWGLYTGDTSSAVDPDDMGVRKPRLQRCK